MDKKTRQEYLENLQIGNIVAFKVGEHMFSGKVVSFPGMCRITVKTKNGSVYYPDISDVVWIKNGTHWPQGIFNALKESKKG